ncbi:MAG: cytochrome b/b6 domain-containing protein, partial [Dehalococcoidales bacterium]
GREAIEDGNVVRHGSGAFLEHWGTALGLFVLIVSGILLGFLFIPSQVQTLEGVFFPLNLHFIGIVVTLFGGSYFAADYLVSWKFRRLLPKPSDITGGFFGKYLLRRKWTAETKYLSSQKAAFLAGAVLGSVVLVTGAIKLAWRVWPIQTEILQWSTVIHDISALLFILYLIVHVLFVLVVPAHRVMLKSWITGKVPEEYVKKEHPLWYEELKKGS